MSVFSGKEWYLEYFQDKKRDMCVICGYFSKLKSCIFMPEPSNKSHEFVKEEGSQEHKSSVKALKLLLLFLVKDKDSVVQVLVAGFVYL